MQERTKIGDLRPDGVTDGQKMMAHPKLIFLIHFSNLSPHTKGELFRVAPCVGASRLLNLEKGENLKPGGKEGS